MAIDRSINLKVQADTAKARADIKKLQTQLNNLSRVKLGTVATSKMTQGMANLGQQTTRTTSQIEKMGGRINAAFNIAIVVGFTNALAKAGDGILNLSNQLKSSGVEAKNLGQNVAFVLRTSNDTRTSFKSAGVLLARMTRSTATLGFGMKDVQKATTTVIKGFQLAGATTQEATQSVIQLSQGLASGALRGDELRSVLEGAPVLAASIAKELGVGVGQLREMGKQGKITSEVVMKALLNDADALDAKFAQMKPTFEGAFEVLKNGLTVAVGETTNILGDALGIKTAFIDAGKALTEMFLDGRVKVFVGEFVRDFREASARIKGFFSDTFDNLGLNLPDLTDILGGLATLLGAKMFAGGRRGQTAFTPVRADVVGLDAEVKDLRKTLKGGFPIGKATGLGLLQQGLGQTKTSVDALRAGLTQGFKLGTVKGLSGLNTGFVQAETSANTFRTALTKGFSVGRITGLDAVFQNIGQVKTSATDLRSNIGKDFKAGALDVKPLTSSLTVVATQLANLRKSMGKGFKIGTSSGTEGSSLTSTGGFLIAPARIAEQKTIVADLNKSIATASATVQGYANGVSRFFGNIATNIGVMADKADFKLGVLDTAIEENRKGLAKATTAYNKHSGAIGRLGLLYDGLADKDFGTDKERSLAARLDAESVKLNEAKADIDRYNGSIKANEAARGSFITGLEAQQKAFTKTQRVFARMAGVMNISLPTLRAGFDKLATTANNVATAFTTMGNNAKTALGKAKGAMAGVGKLQGTLSGQIAGTVGVSILLSEFFTFNEDTSQFENDVIEKVRSGISNAINKYTPLDTDQADLGAKMATIIAGAVGAFAVVSAVAGAIGTLLLSGPVIAAAAIAFTAYIATSESEMADNIRAFLLNALKQVGQIAVKLSLDGVEAVLNAPLNAITGSEGNVQDRQSKAIIQNNKDGNLLDGALIASNTNTLFRGMTEQQVKDARELWQTELDKLMAGNAFERFINSGSIGIFEGAIERAGERLDRIGKAKFGQDTGVGLRSTYNDLLPPAPVKKALGGFISGAGTATSDSIPAMLSDGEFVMKASAVSKFGAGFMAKINAGIMPQMFSQGGGVKANPEALQKLYDEQAKDQKAISGYKVSLPTSSNGFSNGLSDADVGIYEALKTNIAERAADIASLEAKNVKASSSESSSGSSSSSTETKQQKATNKAYGDIGKGYAEQFERTFAKGLKEGLKTGSFKDFIPNLLDSFTSGVVDSFVDGLTATLFEGKIGKDGKRSGGFTGALGGLFGGQARIGSTVAGEDVAKSDIEVLGGGKDALGLGGIFDGAKEWMSGLFGEGGGLSGIFEGFSGGLSSIFGGLGSALGGLFGGGSGGSGGGLGSLLSIGAGFLGFSQGGIVPNTATSQIGKDSVPAMLMPGEVVLSKNDVSRMDNGPAPQQTTFNLKVVGNVDRETRRNIVKMMPQIAQGVNGQNKENNYR